MITCGIDPDSKKTAVAFVWQPDPNQLPVLLAAGVLSQNWNKGRPACITMAELLNRDLSRYVAECDAYAVESQKIYGRGRGRADPDDLIKLATISGAALARLQHMYPRATAYLPEPSEWKGEVPKAIHQARICKRMGWTETERVGTDPRKGYTYPTVTPSETKFFTDRPRKVDWKHLVDAVGLALWAGEQLRKGNR